MKCGGFSKSKVFMYVFFYILIVLAFCPCIPCIGIACEVDFCIFISIAGCLWPCFQAWNQLELLNMKHPPP